MIKINKIVTLQGKKSSKNAERFTLHVPAIMASSLGWKKGDKLNVELTENGLIITDGTAK